MNLALLLFLLLFRHSVKSSNAQEGSLLLHLIGDRASPTARDAYEVASIQSRCCYPNTRNGGLNLVFKQ